MRIKRIKKGPEGLRRRQGYSPKSHPTDRGPIRSGSYPKGKGVVKGPMSYVNAVIGCSYA